MTGKRELKREDLKARLVTAARERIIRHGLNGLRARDITADAGCALGGLYNAFNDLDTLVLHVNSITLTKLGIAMEAASQLSDDPEQKLRNLARGYLHFAVSHQNLWKALFEHTMPEGHAVPEWHLADHKVLFQHIVGPLSAMEPDLLDEELFLRARTAFAAVHGIVAISLEERFVGLPPDQLEAELDRFTALLAAGVRVTSGKT